jgi:hypothetical protein
VLIELGVLDESAADKRETSAPSSAYEALVREAEDTDPSNRKNENETKTKTTLWRRCVASDARASDARRVFGVDARGGVFFYKRERRLFARFAKTAPCTRSFSALCSGTGRFRV